MILFLRKVLIDQEEIHLTPIEFNLLKLLIEHRGKVLTHNYIQKEIWGYQDHSNQNALRVFMATLQSKNRKRYESSSFYCHRSRCRILLLKINKGNLVFLFPNN